MFVQLRVWVFVTTHHLWRNLAANLTVCWLYQTHSFLLRMNLTITANLETRYEITFMQHLDFIHRVHSCKVSSYSHTFTRVWYIYIYIQTYSLLATKKLYIYNIQMQEASLATSVVFSHWPMVWFTFPLGWAPTDDGFHDSNFALAVLAATSIGREKRKHGVYQHDTHV